MALSIVSNELTMSVQRNLNVNNEKLDSTIKRVSSGNRIVSAADDPAGLAISDTLNATIRSMGQAIRNSQDGMSMLQVYEGGTSEINNALVRIRELAMQSSSDTLGDRERTMLNQESSQLKAEIDRIAKTTQFQGSFLLNGDKVDFQFQIGVNNVDDIDRIRFNPTDNNLTMSGLGISGVDVSDRDSARGSLDTIDQALNRLNEVRAEVGAAESRLHSTTNTQQIYQENLSAARSRIADADIASESANLAKESILRKAGVAVLSQANETPALALQLLR